MNITLKERAQNKTALTNYIFLYIGPFIFITLSFDTHATLLFQSHLSFSPSQALLALRIIQRKVKTLYRPWHPFLSVPHLLLSTCCSNTRASQLFLENLIHVPIPESLYFFTLHSFSYNISGPFIHLLTDAFHPLPGM